MHRLSFTLSLLLVVSLVGPALAQQPQGSPDFLFGRPRGSVGVRSGWLFERADSNFFQFIQDELTIDKRALDSPALAVDAGVALSSRADVVFGFEFGSASTRSEYRNYVDNNRLPINQDTRLRQMNLSGSLKLALTPRGEEVSRLAWVPRTVTPYIGAGGGALWYQFHQTGDFVDFVDLSVFTDTFRSSGWTPSAHVFGGVDVKVARRLFLTGEGRYQWSHAEMTGDFYGQSRDSRSAGPRLDLTGFKITAGVNYIF